MTLTAKKLPLPEAEDAGDIFSEMMPALIFVLILFALVVIGTIASLIWLIGTKTFFLCLSPFILYFLFDYLPKENQKIDTEKK